MGLAEVFPVIRAHAEAESQYEEQVREMEDTVLEFAQLRERGPVGELAKDYLTVELMSFEEKLEQMRATGRKLAAELRKVYGLSEKEYPRN